MSNYIPYNTPGGVLWIQVENTADGTHNINAFQSTAFSSFEDVVNAMTSNTAYLQEKLSTLGPSAMEISFGIKAGAAPNPIAGSKKAIFTLAKGNDDANINIKIKWEPKK